MRFIIVESFSRNLDYEIVRVGKKFEANIVGVTTTSIEAFDKILKFKILIKNELITLCIVVRGQLPPQKTRWWPNEYTFFRKKKEKLWSKKKLRKDFSMCLVPTTLCPTIYVISMGRISLSIHEVLTYFV